MGGPEGKEPSTGTIPMSVGTWPAGPHTPHRRTFPDERIRETLRALGLDRLEGRLDAVEPWDQELSDHEKQRLAFARVLLHEPRWLFLDKATSALDEATERRVYELLAERLPRAAVITAAHRPAVVAYHSRRWTIAPQAGGPGTLQAA